MAMSEPEGQALAEALRREFGEDTLRY
jgi:hypothetical protein